MANSRQINVVYDPRLPRLETQILRSLRSFFFPPVAAEYSRFSLFKRPNGIYSILYYHHGTRRLRIASTPDFDFVLTIYGGFLTEEGRYAEADSAFKDADRIFRQLLSSAALGTGDNVRNQAAPPSQIGRVKIQCRVKIQHNKVAIQIRNRYFTRG